MNDYVKAWQCNGCGRVEGPQTCIGVCQDRKVEFVYAFEHERTLAELTRARQRGNALEALVRRLACTNPRKDEWEPSYRAFQEQARSMLAGMEAVAPVREPA